MIKLLAKIILITLTVVAVFLLIDTIGVAGDLFRLYKKNSGSYAVKRAVNKELKDLTAQQQLLTPKAQALPVQDLQVKYSQPIQVTPAVKQRKVIVETGGAKITQNTWQSKEAVIQPPKQQKIESWQAERIFESTSRLTRDIK